MTPTERAVVEAALRWHHADKPDRQNALTDLAGALVYLETEREGATTDQEKTFGDVSVDDQIKSTSGKWYKVTRTARDGSSVRVWLEGVPKPLEKFTGQAVTLRRGESGAAVDTFTVLWSGPTGRGAAA